MYSPWHQHLHFRCQIWCPNPSSSPTPWHHGGLHHDATLLNLQVCSKCTAMCALWALGLLGPRALWALPPLGASVPQSPSTPWAEGPVTAVPFFLLRPGTDGATGGVGWGYKPLKIHKSSCTSEPGHVGC